MEECYFLVKRQTKARSDRHCHKFTFTSSTVLSGEWRFSDNFRGYRSVTLIENVLKQHTFYEHKM